MLVPLAVAGGVGLAACQTTLSLNVNTTADGHDAVPGDGICEVHVGSDDCSLRAAIEESNSSSAMAFVALPGGTYSVGATGSIPVAASAAIRLTGEGHPVIDATGASPAFPVNGTFVVSGITVTNAATGFDVASGGRLVLGASSLTDDTLGVNVAAGGRLESTGVTFTGDDKAVTSSGTLFVDHASITGAPANGQTAAVSVAAGTASITDTSISHNLSAGILVAGDAAKVDVERSTIDHNQSEPDCVNAGCVTNGTGPGGVFVEKGSLTMVNSTVTGNTVFNELADVTSPAGIEVGFATCGAGTCVFDTGTATVFSSTVADPVLAVLGTTTIFDSALNACTNVNLGGVGSGAATLVDGGGNVSVGTACPGTHVPSLLLTPLANNGGATLTRLPQAGSPLLDHIPSGTALLCDGTNPIDQRDVSRPQGAGCDAGSVEVG